MNKCMRGKYFLPVLFLIAISCKKDAENFSAEIQGTWELASSDGAWVGHHEYPLGNGNTYTFIGNEYTQTSKSADTTYTYSGTFYIYSGKPCDFAKEQTLIVLGTMNPMAESLSLSNGKLTIGTTECIADGGSSTYRKIQ